MGDIEVIGRIVLGRGEVLRTLLLSALVLGPTAALVARRLGWSHGRMLLAALAGASLALVPATTLARGDLQIDFARACDLRPALLSTSPEAVLNLLLFAPAAFFGVLATRRFTGTVLAAMACSVLVETVQLVAGLGTCQTGDMLRNTVGAAAAGGVAALLLRTPPAVRRQTGTSSTAPTA